MSWELRVGLNLLRTQLSALTPNLVLGYDVYTLDGLVERRNTTLWGGQESDMDSHAPFDDRFARSVQTPEEAEIVLHAFIREGQQADSQHHVREKSKGYDLYLPWLMEVVEYVIPLEDHEPLGLLELQQLYLDVAWRMVMKGVLRPGPKMVNAATDSNIYGLAFTLMQGVEI